ncbi:MAG: MATE family efflux transporter [Lachnospiraceae bacterium]|jgi:putative MATE family efflux protein|nr:MATE family efflux transporter [Lachnospiraceae bacterium]
MSETVIKDFTKGSIPRMLFAFMLPFMASNALQVLYSTVDMIVVGRFVGSAGLSAVAMGSQILNLSTMLCSGLSVGGQVLIAQMIGAGRKDDLNNVIGTMFTLLMLMGVFFTLMIVAMRTPLLLLINIPIESFNMGLSYLTICGACLLFTFGYNMVSAVLRGMGDSKHPFWFITIASVINLILDLLFIGGFGWGVAGAAWATILGQAFSFFYSLYFMYKRKEQFHFDFKLKSLRPVKKHMSTMVGQGLPLALQSGLIYFSMFYVNSMVNKLGLTASATFSVGVRIDDICNKLSIAVRNAASPMIAQNWAAHEIPRCKKIVYWSWAYVILFHGIFVFFYVLYGNLAFKLFTTDSEVLALAPVFIKAILWTFLGLAFLRGCSAFVEGIGNAKLGMLFGLMDGVILRVGLSTLLGITLGLGFYGFVLGYGLAPFGAVIPSMWYFVAGKWKKRKTLVE